MIHPRTESQLDRAELLRLAVLRLDARRPGTVERLNDFSVRMFDRKEADASIGNNAKEKSISPLLETGVVDGDTGSRLSCDQGVTEPASVSPSATNTGDRGLPGILSVTESDCSG